MKGALGFIGVFLCFLSGECVVSALQLQMPVSVLSHVEKLVEQGTFFRLCFIRLNEKCLSSGLKKVYVN